MRLKLLGVVALLSVAVAAFFMLQEHVVPEDEPVEPCVGDACGLGGSSAEEDLALKYAPVIYLGDKVTDCNLSDGDFRPIPVDAVLGNPQVTLRHRGETGPWQPPVEAPTARDLYNAEWDYYLDLPGNPRRPGCRYVRDAQTFSTGYPEVAYARIATEEGFDELVLQYWFFYYFNQWNNKHEGDWEMMQIVFEASSAAEALNEEPLRVAYSQHSTGELAQWDDKKLEKEGNRPVLRVAAGSHSNRYSQHVFIGRGEQGFGCDDASGDIRLSIEPRLVPEKISGPDDPYAWLAFSGRWGELAGPEFDGPSGPNTKRSWNQPLTWEESLRTQSVRLPDRDSIGPSAIEAFCDIVAIGSNLILPIYLQLPQLTFAAVGVFGVGMVVSLTRTRFIPARRQPLRAHRRLGRILLSALTIYTTNARHFVGIGLVFLPVALTVSVLHWLVLHVSPIEPIVPLPRADVGQDIIVAFALAELQFGMAYGIVLVACTAALGAIDTRRPVGVKQAYVEIWHTLPRWLPPRLFAIAVVAGLAFTIIGIPLAIRQAIRWTFIEQAVLLEGASPREALAVSSDAADRNWWWAAGAAILLGAVGLFLAPAVGVVLILAAQSIPLADINIITSVIHVALVPFVAIAQALVFFELRTRQPR